MSAELITRILAAALTLSIWSLCSGPAQAQDLEPRRWSHLPVGLNVIGAGAAWTGADIYFDPVLLIEDASADIYATGIGYVRSFGLLGRTSRIDVNLPYASGWWEGMVDGQFTSIRRRGFLDPRVRISVNLYGAPAMRGREYVAFRQENVVNTTIGAALEVTLPLGDYNETKLINLGGNRVVYRPQLGILHQRGNLQLELTGSVFIFETNDEFWSGNRLKQDPLWFGQAHVIYAFKRGWWGSLSGGFAHGGRSTVSGSRKTDDRRTRYIALTLGAPISPQQSLKITFLTGDTHVSVGDKRNALLLGWSFTWGM